MPPQPSTSLRVRFAKAMGWNTQKETLGGVYIYRDPKGNIAAVLPDPTDANTVREALIGMTEEEWDKLSHKISQINYRGSTTKFILTLAELICEVRGVK